MFIYYKLNFLSLEDGCHIEVHFKGKYATDYLSYKGWYSVVLFALVDAKYVAEFIISIYIHITYLCINLLLLPSYNFMYTNVGCPQWCNDSTIYENSTLKQQLQNTALLNEFSLPMGSVNDPIVILADSAFRLSTSVMKPYPFHVDKTESQK